MAASEGVMEHEEVSPALLIASLRIRREDDALLDRGRDR